MEDAEWVNLISHIRRVEWASVNEDDDPDTDAKSEPLPKKPKLQKYNWPNPHRLKENVKVYRDIITAKLRCLEPHASNFYKTKNNLSSNLRSALQELNKAVKSNEIVICKSDKDVKLFG